MAADLCTTLIAAHIELFSSFHNNWQTFSGLFLMLDVFSTMDSCHLEIPSYGQSPQANRRKLSSAANS